VCRLDTDFAGMAKARAGTHAGTVRAMESPARVKLTWGGCGCWSGACSGGTPTPVCGDPVTNVTHTSCGDT